MRVSLGQTKHYISTGNTHQSPLCLFVVWRMQTVHSWMAEIAKRLARKAKCQAHMLKSNASVWVTAFNENFIFVAIFITLWDFLSTDCLFICWLSCTVWLCFEVSLKLWHRRKDWFVTSVITIYCFLWMPRGIIMKVKIQ